MRLAAALLLVLLSTPVIEAAACPAHAPRSVRGPSQRKIAAVEPARILVVEIDLGSRFIKALEELGHEVRVARDASELARSSAEGRWDVAITTADRARDLLENLSIAMVVPVAAEPERASDFEFVIDSEAFGVKQQIEVLHRALARRPVTYAER